MRPLLVVDRAPHIEGRLVRSQVVEAVVLQHLQIQRAMDPLVLTLGLRVAWPAVQQRDARL